MVMKLLRDKHRLLVVPQPCSLAENLRFLAFCSKAAAGSKMLGARLVALWLPLCRLLPLRRFSSYRFAYRSDSRKRRDAPSRPIQTVRFFCSPVLAFQERADASLCFRISSEFLGSSFKFDVALEKLETVLLSTG